MKRSLLTAATCLVAAAGVIGCGGSDATDETASSSEPAVSATSPGSSSFATLPTKKCRTSEGMDRPDVPLEAATTLPVSSEELEGFVAFTNTSGSVLIGPRDWKCSSTIAVDGGETIALTPDGSDPFEEGSEVGITYDVSAGCQGCMADEICSVLPDAPVVQRYADMGVGCSRSKPLKEKLTPIGDLSVMFEDPPGVKGQGDPSGGSARSIGMLTYSEYLGTRQVSCTVPEELSASCPSVVSGSVLHSLTNLNQSS